MPKVSGLGFGGQAAAPEAWTVFTSQAAQDVAVSTKRKTPDPEP